MKYYKNIPRKDFIIAINEIIAKTNVDKRLLFLKSSLIVKDDFVPSNFISINWYAGNSELDAQLILETPKNQLGFYHKKAEKTFIPAENECSEVGIYTILPFNFLEQDYLNTLLKLLADKAYKNIYLVTEYKKQDLNLHGLYVSSLTW